MLLTKACEYGIRSVLFVAKQSLEGKRSTLKEIASEIEAPQPFVAKIMQQLVRGNVVVSVKGISGGFYIEPSQIKEITLTNIVFAIDKNFDSKLCAMGLKECSEVRPCPIHHTYKAIKKDIISMMDKSNLIEMAESLKNGTCFLSNLPKQPINNLQ